MIADRLEGKWIDLFAEVFALCKVGEAVVRDGKLVAWPAASAR